MTSFAKAARLADSIDQRLTRRMARHGVDALRVSMGVIYLWFGALKFFPGASPAELLATDTIRVLTFGLIPGELAIIGLAMLETAIGFGLVTGRALRLVIALLLLQMVGTMSPLVITPELCFSDFPFVLTLEGQYILKNLVLVSSALVVGATVRGGRLETEPKPT